MTPTQAAMYHSSPYGPGTGLQASQAMSVISGTEAAYLLEARLDYTYTGELQPFIELIRSWHRNGAEQHRGTVTEELKGASRKVGGYWKRIILLYQNDQLRPNLFVPGSHWLLRSQDFRAATEPLDTQIRIQESKQLSWSPMNKQYPPLRPHTFRTLEELERQAQQFAGEETLKRFIAKRKEALRLCDEEARKRYAASAKDIRHQAHFDGEPLGAARALSLREKFFAAAASPLKAPRVVTPAIQIPSTEEPAMTHPAPKDRVQPPTTPAQPAVDIMALRAARMPLQAPAEEPSSTSSLPDEATAQSPGNATVLEPPGTTAPTPVRAGISQSAEPSVDISAIPSSSAGLAESTAAPSVLVRKLARGGEQGVESDEADKALSALMAQLPASADHISPSAQQALTETAHAEPADTKEPTKIMQDGAAPAPPETTKHGGVVDQAAIRSGAEAVQKQELLSTEAISQQAPAQRLLNVPAERPASSAAAAPEEEPVADRGSGAARALSEEPEGVHNNIAREESAGLQQMQSVQVVVAGPSQRPKPANPFFELKSFDPELLQAAEQQHSMSLKSTQSTDDSQREQSLPNNPFFEIRGPASSPDQLLRRATLYLLAGENLSATAADLGIAPMSRANTEPICGQDSVTAPAVAASELEPKAIRQPEMASDALAPATSAVLPATSMLAPVPLAPVAEQLSAEGPSGADADVSFMDSQPSAQPKPLPSTSSEGDASSRQSSHDTSSGKSSDIYLPAWKGSQEAPAETQAAVKAEAPAPASARGKEKAEDIAAGSSAPNSAPNSGRLPSWLPGTPGQSMETFPKAAILSQGSMSGPMSSGSSNSWSGSLASKAFQLAEQLRHGDAPAKITAARRLQRLAASRSQVGDAVWEAEGVLALTAMLKSQDPQQFDAAASAIAELADPDNRAFQIGVGESGGLKALLAAVDGEDEAQSALAAKALASVVRGTPALQEVLLDAGGADVLIRHLDAPETPQADAENEGKGTGAPQGDISDLEVQQSFELPTASASGACKVEEVAEAIAAFASGFSPGQRAIVGAGGLPKLTQLLMSAPPAVQNNALSALLACTTKNAEYQALMTEAGALPILARIARGAPSHSCNPEPPKAPAEGEGAAESLAVAPPRATVMAQQAVKLLYSLSSYFAGHAALQADRCLEVLVTVMASSDVTCAQYAVWAIQSLTAGNGKTEKGLCDAGAIQGLLGLTRRCLEQPEEDAKPARKSSRKARAPPPSLRNLLEPAIVALSNLAAETASVKEDMRQAGAIETCVQLLTAKGNTVPGHAARALWNLTSKNAANQNAAREAGAVPLLVAMLSTAPKQSKGKKVSTCEEAAGTVGSMATCNAPNQEAFRVAGALPLLLELVLTAERSIKEQAAWALHAMTSKNKACMEDMVTLEAPARLLPLLSHPELWNWTPVVSTMQSMSGGTQQAQHALVRSDAMPVFLDILSFGRPTLQALSAAILGNLASNGDEDFKRSFVEAGGLEKLRELCRSDSLASTPVRKAAASALADITKGKPRRAARKTPRTRFSAKGILSSSSWCLGTREAPT